jgi:DNA invertase Pin-like site-specific DNA recombinase
MKKTAISYIRFSTMQQQEGESLERQARLARDYAAKHGMDLDENLTMRDLGVSAFTGKNLARGALGVFVKAVLDKKVPPNCYLLIEDVDRLSRLPVMEALDVFKIIINGGVTVVTLKDEIQYTAEGLRDDWTRIMPVLVSMGRGYDESVRKSDRIRDGWAAKKTKARNEKTPLGALAPAWLVYVPPNEKSGTPARYDVDQSKVDVIELIFKLSIGGKGMVAIAHELRERGIPPFGKRGVGSWSGSSLQRLLKNRALLGEYQPSEYIPYIENGVRKRKQKLVGRPIEEFYPPVIDEGTFLKATEALESRKIHNVTRQPKKVNVWQGVIKCAHCGGALHLTTREHKYLICYKARLGQCKDAKFIRLDLAEEYFKQMLAKIDSMALVESSNHELDAQLMNAKVALSKCQSDVDYFMNQFRNPETRSNGLAMLLAEAEQSVKSAEAHVKEVESLYAKEAIVDKEEFFQRLDLESDEGRHSANALVKQVNVCAYASGKVFQVRQSGTPLFSISPHYTGRILITAHTAEQMQKVMVQDGASLDQVIDFNREQRKAAGIPEPTWTPPSPNDQGTHLEEVEEWDWSNTTLDPDEYTAR